MGRGRGGSRVWAPAAGNGLPGEPVLCPSEQRPPHCAAPGPVAGTPPSTGGSGLLQGHAVASDMSTSRRRDGRQPAARDSSCNRHSSPFLPFSAALVRASVRFPAVRRQKETLRRGPPRPGPVPTAVCCSRTVTPAPPAKAQALEKAGDEAKATGLSRCLVRVQISPVRDDAGLTPITMPRSLNQ